MKKLKYSFPILFAFAFIACDSDDDGFYNETYVDIPNLVAIDTQPSYAVGDFIYVDADFSRFLTEPGQNTLLDIYATTNGAEDFNFTYILEKNVGGIWTLVEIPTNTLAIVEGSAESSSFVYGHAAYDATDGTYEYRVGLPLQSAGEYRLSFGYNSESPNQVELRSESVGNSLFLNINSTTQNLNTEGYYIFTVN